MRAVAKLPMCQINSEIDLNLAIGYMHEEMPHLNRDDAGAAIYAVTEVPELPTDRSTLADVDASK